MTKKKIRYGDDVWVWTFTGWEKFDWGSPAFESAEDAINALSAHSKITTVKP